MSARKLISSHNWPGNVRELLNTLRRAAIWSTQETLTAEVIRDALLPWEGAGAQRILDRPLGRGVDLPDIIASVARHYLGRALEETHGNKTRAAALVGLPSYQTFTNWMNRYGVTG